MLGGLTLPVQYVRDDDAIYFHLPTKLGPFRLSFSQLWELPEPSDEFRPWNYSGIRDFAPSFCTMIQIRTMVWRQTSPLLFSSSLASICGKDIVSIKI